MSVFVSLDRLLVARERQRRRLDAYLSARMRADPNALNDTSARRGRKGETREPYLSISFTENRIEPRDFAPSFLRERSHGRIRTSMRPAPTGGLRICLFHELLPHFS